MNCCTSSCGWCGRCDDGLGESPEPDPYLMCDHCGGDAFHPMTLAGVGVACSRTCLDALARKHEAAMQKVSA